MRKQLLVVERALSAIPILSSDWRNQNRDDKAALLKRMLDFLSVTSVKEINDMTEDEIDEELLARNGQVCELTS